MNILTVSLTFNVLLYIAAACLFYRLVLIADDDNKILSQDQQKHYAGFILLLSIIWPFSLVFIALSKQETQKAED